MKQMDFYKLDPVSKKWKSMYRVASKYGFMAMSLSKNYAISIEPDKGSPYIKFYIKVNGSWTTEKQQIKFPGKALWAILGDMEGEGKAIALINMESSNVHMYARGFDNNGTWTTKPQLKGKFCDYGFSSKSMFSCDCSFRTVTVTQINKTGDFGTNETITPETGILPFFSTPLSSTMTYDGRFFYSDGTRVVMAKYDGTKYVRDGSMDTNVCVASKKYLTYISYDGTSAAIVEEGVKVWLYDLNYKIN